MYKYAFAAALCAVSTPALAGDIGVLKGGSLHVGPYTGVAYYEETAEGYKVVATLGLEGEVPVRFVTTLVANGQQVLISVPGKVGEPDHELVIVRDTDKLVITEPTPVTALAIEEK